jgi:hypothetical protein
MSIDNLLIQYSKIRESIKSCNNTLFELKKEEKDIVKEIEIYLTESGETEITFDSDTMLVLTTIDKKIPRTKPEYKEKLNEICTEQGLDSIELINEILNAKIKTTVQHQKLKLLRKK